MTVDSPGVDDGTVRRLRRRYESARARRGQWENLWRDAYDYALPQRQGFGAGIRPGETRMEKLYDGTALDSVEQLAASLLGNLMPPWTQWFGLKPGPDLTPAQAEALAPVLEKAARTIQAQLDRSNFMVEIHQCFLDLIVGGTACLYIEPADPGAFSAFRFTAIPLSGIVLEEGAEGMLDGGYRNVKLTLAQMRARYPRAEIPAKIERAGETDPQARFEILESVLPEGGKIAFTALLLDEPATVLKQVQISESPLLAFRWLKSPGEIYGRSPVMKALPDIKTANKVVELILKNASIAVTGIWQADDDGVLNPANIQLKPGTIIPKAVGSQGLKPLEMPGRFDISQIVLDDLRGRIRHALLTDKLGPVTSRTMTATEVLERSAEMGLLLGATYGRLQVELMTPLIQRAYAILRRRGAVPDVNIDGRYVTLDYRSPLARAQGQRNVQNTLFWLQSVQLMGPAAMPAVNWPQAARVLGDALGVPADLILNELPPMEDMQHAQDPVPAEDHLGTQIPVQPGGADESATGY